MKLINKSGIPEIDAFLRIFGDAINERCEGYSKDIVFENLDLINNEYDDIVVRLDNHIYVSPSWTDKIGFNCPELFAALAHELGHILYRTDPWKSYDSESRADEFAVELGLTTQMISVIEKIIACRKFRHITSSLVRRIQYLQHFA